MSMGTSTDGSTEPGAPDGGERTFVERVLHRLRAVSHGQVAIDTLDAVVLTRRYLVPQYLVPQADVVNVMADGLVAAAAPLANIDVEVIGAPLDLAGYVAVPWDAMDRWYAEEDEVIGHARDPRHRADALRSRRPVEVFLDGAVVAATDHPVVLVETDRPLRYFIPRVDVRADLLRRSATVSASPYLGVATHWSTTVAGTVRDVAVSYAAPRLDVSILENLIAFDESLVEVRVGDPRSTERTSS